MAKLHDPYSRPPELMRSLFKRWRKASTTDLPSSVETYLNGTVVEDKLKEVSHLDEFSAKDHWKVSEEFCNTTPPLSLSSLEDLRPALTDRVYEISSLPGLYLFPSLLTPKVQLGILEKLLHRDLSDPVHNTNIDLHFHRRDLIQANAMTSTDALGQPYESFFSIPQDTFILQRDPALHKPITFKQLLESKLRWVTLGGQYDWTNKVYPPDPPPRFPSDIAALMKGLFPKVDAQAAIVNFYSPGDTLSVHRDVSEDCDRGLISASIGCDCIFIVGNEDGSSSSTIRLQSGDVLLMSGESRYAWHGVPKIIAGTCPSWLQNWPVMSDSESDKYYAWREWMKNKRINLNIRQMSESLP